MTGGLYVSGTTVVFSFVLAPEPTPPAASEWGVLVRFPDDEMVFSGDALTTYTPPTSNTQGACTYQFTPSQAGKYEIYIVTGSSRASLTVKAVRRWYNLGSLPDTPGIDTAYNATSPVGETAPVTPAPGDPDAPYTPPPSPPGPTIPINSTAQKMYANDFDDVIDGYVGLGVDLTAGEKHVDWDDTGLNMYILSAGYIYWFTCSGTGFDMSTSGLTYKSRTLIDTNMRKFFISDDGTSFLATDYAGSPNTWQRYTLSTPYDPSTFSLDSGNSYVATHTGSGYGPMATRNGTKLFLAAHSGGTGTAYQWALGTIDDLTTAAPGTSQDISDSMSNPPAGYSGTGSIYGAYMQTDGTKMYILVWYQGSGDPPEVMFTYTLSTPFDVTTATLDSTTPHIFSTADYGDSSEGIYVDPSNTVAFITVVGVGNNMHIVKEVI